MNGCFEGNLILERNVCLLLSELGTHRYGGSLDYLIYDNNNLFVTKFLNKIALL